MPKLGVTSDPEPIACVPRQVERSSCAITFMIAERLVGLDQPLWSFGAIVLAFYRDTTYCVVIELRPNALASPRTARLTDDIHP
jgi:hypothetical protein